MILFRTSGSYSNYYDAAPDDFQWPDLRPRNATTSARDGGPTPVRSRGSRSEVLLEVKMLLVVELLELEVLLKMGC